MTAPRSLQAELLKPGLVCRSSLSTTVAFKRTSPFPSRLFPWGVWWHFDIGSLWRVGLGVDKGLSHGAELSKGAQTGFQFPPPFTGCS